MLHRFPKRLGVISAQAFEVSVSHDGRRVVAYHAATVSRTRPLGQESALLIGVDESFLHLLVHRGIHQVEEGEEAAEGVPEAGVGEHVARQHLSVIRTVVHHTSVGVGLVEAAREKERAVKARIERAEVVGVVVGDLHTTQNLVPPCPATCRHLVDAVVSELLQIEQRLLRTYERRRHTHVDLLSALHAEAHDGTRMIARGAERGGVYVAVGDGGGILERSVKDKHEVVLEVFGHTAAVLRGVAHNHVLGRNNLRVRAFVERIEHDVCLVGLREGEAHRHSALRRGELGGDVVVGEIHFIIIRTRHLSLMREP